MRWVPCFRRLPPTPGQCHEFRPRKHACASGGIMSQYFPATSELTERTISPGVGLRIMSSQHMSLSQATLAANATVPEHSHPHEQIGIVIDGRVRFTIGTEEK